MRRFQGGLPTNACSTSEEEQVDLIKFSEINAKFLFIDKLILRRLENNVDSLGGSTGSILNIRNLKLGLTLSSNKFENNVGYTGSSLFIHQFDINGDSDSKASVILIKKNSFKNNMAILYGLNIVILKFETDFINMKCGGIQLNENTFENNAGCPKTFGNVIISCSPAKLSAKNFPYDLYNTFGSDNYYKDYKLSYTFGFECQQNTNFLDDSCVYFQRLLKNFLIDKYENRGKKNKKIIKI